MVISANQGFNNKVRVHDIAEKKDQIAILFTAQSTDVEIVKLNKPNEYMIQSKRSLFTQSSQKIISAGKLAWLDDLYVLLDSSPDGIEVWRIEKDKVIKMFQDK